MKYILVVSCFLILGCFYTVQAQFDFKKHKVVQGEDVYSIAQSYGTTPEAIYNLNPTAKEGIKPDTFLVLPNVIKAPELPVEGIEFKKHKTKSRQTLYSIAKKYKITVDAIKKHNVFLNSRELKKGDIIKIPLPATKKIKIIRRIGKNSNKENTKTPQDTTQIYTVKPKETRYGIARKFGITIPELENMNPNLGEDFPIGIKILVPAKIKEEPLAENNQFALYEVPAKQTMYSLCRQYKISSDSIIALNPMVKEGLKQGMILRLPDLNFLEEGSLNNTIDLSSRLYNFSEKSIAVLLPFCTNGINFSDTEKIKQELQKNRVTRLSVDFYTGVLMAIEKAKSYGISSNVTVCDTQKSKKITANLVKSKDLKEKDAIVGPFYSKNVSELSNLLKNSQVPIFSPISNKVGLSSYSNLYQTIPSEKVLAQKLITYVKNDSLPKNIVIIADKKHEADKQMLLNNFPNAKLLNPQEEGFLTEDDLIKVMGEEESKIPFWVFLQTSNIQLVSNVVPFLNARSKSHKITLFTTNRTNAFENESILNTHLSNLNFHYPSVKKLIDSSEKTPFYLKYKSKYKSFPSRYAVRGYDLMLDVLLRLSSANLSKEMTFENRTTSYLENKFTYFVNAQNGISNKACYIIKYEKGLKFAIIE